MASSSVLLLWLERFDFSHCSACQVCRHGLATAFPVPFLSSLRCSISTTSRVIETLAAESSCLQCLQQGWPIRSQLCHRISQILVMWHPTTRPSVRCKGIKNDLKLETCPLINSAYTLLGQDIKDAFGVCHNHYPAHVWLLLLLDMLQRMSSAAPYAHSPCHNTCHSKSQATLPLPMPCSLMPLQYTMYCSLLLGISYCTILGC
eukprot:2173626-Amphidinium_carterae.1